MALPTVYVETTVIGYLTARQQPDPIVAGHQVATKKWWMNASDRFQLVISTAVVEECAAGDATAASERLKVIEGIRLVSVDERVESLIQLLLDQFAVPHTEPEDAAHIALAAVHGIEYLVTWNFRHIANPSTRRKIEDVIVHAGFRAPVICTPEELTED